MLLTRFTALTSLSVALLSSASAHDAWIEVSPASETASANWHADLFIGHAEDRDAYALDAPRIASLHSINGEGWTSHLDQMLSHKIGTSLDLKLPGDQAQLLTLNTFRAFSELDAEKFNEYVVEEGISPILDWRVENGETGTPGTEVYSRFLKAIIPDPAGDCDTSLIGAPVGQVLEIVPVTNPMTGCEGELVFELHYFGEPVEGATLHLNRTDETLEPIKARTDAQGQASFKRPEGGQWYVHAAWAMPVDSARFDADFATSFSSLSFNLD
ncbi:MAG: hypothetical protein CMK09_18035 [Ponticaulis sp.]|nr:hypothetical protein [Ponticaulis sp.]|tara:strand:+ start:33098 stop:33910 length:813 start_codon:yes stop_codon:yes gene_type:complete